MIIKRVIFGKLLTAILKLDSTVTESFELHIPVDNNKFTAIDLLLQHCSLSKSQLKQAIFKGALWLSKGKKTTRFRRIKRVLTIGEKIHFYYNPDVLSQSPESALLIDDLSDYSVWYKPYGMLSQGSKYSDHCTMARWAQLHLTPERPVFIVHRLDRAATGLMLLAHSKKAARMLSKMFELHQLEKHYRIIVHGDHRQRPQPDHITLPIDDKAANSTFSHIQYDEKSQMSLVNVNIGSGRKHQIRLHAASIGLPVVGDRLHGVTKEGDEITTAQINLQLCAVSLTFNCPLNHKKRHFQLPEHLQPKLSTLSKLITNS